MLFALVWLFGFVVLFLLDFYNLKREDVYPESASFPLGEVAIIILIAIVGVPYVLANRRRRVKEFVAGGGKLSGWHMFFTLSYFAIFIVGLPLVACCWWLAAEY